MLRHEIEDFLNSFSEESLNKSWKKYDAYSKKDTTTVSKLLEHWRAHYKNTFVIKSCELSESTEKIKTKKTESNFGFFFNIV